MIALNVPRVHPQTILWDNRTVHMDKLFFRLRRRGLLAVGESREEPRLYLDALDLDALAERLALCTLLIEALTARSDPGRPEAA